MIVITTTSLSHHKTSIAYFLPADLFLMWNQQNDTGDDPIRFKSQTYKTENVTASKSETSFSSGSSVYYLLLMIMVPVLVICMQLLAASQGEIQGTPSTSSSLQFNRRIQHAITGLIFYGLSYVLPSSLAIALLCISTLAFYVLHIARSQSHVVQEYYLKHFGPLLRDHEKKLNVLSGAFWFLVGTTIVVCVFPINIARTSILCLAFGDPFAAIVGISVGGPKLCLASNNKIDGGGSKSVAGCLACFWSCYLVSFICMRELGPDAWFLTGFVATVMEGLNIFSSIPLDDNVLIPVGTGVALWFYTTVTS